MEAFYGNEYKLNARLTVRLFNRSANITWVFLWPFFAVVFPSDSLTKQQTKPNQTIDLKTSSFTSAVLGYLHWRNRESRSTNKWGSNVIVLFQTPPHPSLDLSSGNQGQVLNPDTICEVSLKPRNRCSEKSRTQAPSARGLKTQLCKS